MTAANNSVRSTTEHIVTDFFCSSIVITHSSVSLLHAVSVCVLCVFLQNTERERETDWDGGLVNVTVGFIEVNEERRLRR